MSHAAHDGDDEQGRNEQPESRTAPFLSVARGRGHALRRMQRCVLRVCVRAHGKTLKWVRWSEVVRRSARASYCPTSAALSPDSLMRRLPRRRGRNIDRISSENKGNSDQFAWTRPAPRDEETVRRNTRRRARCGTHTGEATRAPRRDNHLWRCVKHLTASAAGEKHAAVKRLVTIDANLRGLGRLQRSCRAARAETVARRREPHGRVGQDSSVGHLNPERARAGTTTRSTSSVHVRA